MSKLEPFVKDANGNLQLSKRAKVELFIIFGGFPGIIVLSVIMLKLFGPGYFPLQFEVDSITVSSMTISTDNTTKNYHMTADFNVTLTETNKENSLLFMESVIVSVDYRRQFLSSVVLDPFSLKSRSQKNMQIGMSLDEIEVNQIIVEGISQDLATNKELELDFHIKNQYRLLGGNPASYKCYMDVTCTGIKIEFPLPYHDNISGSNTTGGPIPCKSMSSVCNTPYNPPFFPYFPRRN